MEVNAEKPINESEKLHHGKECYFTVEDTRLSNPLVLLEELDGIDGNGCVLTHKSVF